MSEKPVASIKTLARYEPDTVYIGTGEYVAECVRADDGDYYLAADVDAAIEALQAEIEALRAEVERLRTDRDSWEQQASDRVADWHAEHLRAERLAEALRESHGEVLRLRAAMFRVYATAANGGNPTMYIEQMRDEMDKPWSGDKASAALEQESGRG